ncbi:MAG TPA: polysaccharide deacetylase family protein [Anaerolineae bacterium]|nr:polysaccharide deacetylase family protein [Anaerolineae bacterium]
MRTDKRIVEGQLNPRLLAIVGVVTMCLTIVVAELVQHSAAETRARAPVVGRYRLRLPDYSQGTNAVPASAEYDLTLNNNGTAQLEEITTKTSLIAQGTWRLEDDGVTIDVDELYGKRAPRSSEIRCEMLDGFPVAIDLVLGETLHNLENARFTLGAGERHPLVPKLHSLLAGIQWLRFTDPGHDLYTEETRKAVVAFQASQGQEPSGEVNEATWELLGSPQPPLPTPTPLPSAMDVMGTQGLAELLNLPTHTDDGRPIVYLTFDDGPSDYTPQIVDLLAAHDARATFFVVGEQVELEPDAMRMVVQGGHRVGNHGYDHASLEGLSLEAFIGQVGQTEQAILSAAGDLLTVGYNVRYLRPPYGITDDNARQYAANLGYTLVLWDVDPQDWRRPGADVISDYILGNVFPGVIVLMHDGGGDCTQSVQALKTVLRELSAQGFAFRSIIIP